MPAAEVMQGTRPVTRSGLVRDLRGLGIRPGGVLMVHTRMSGSPLAKLVEAGGQVLLLGAPLDRLTILHHAESLVDSPEKRMARHVIPVREGGEVVWREVFDHDRVELMGYGGKDR